MPMIHKTFQTKIECWPIHTNMDLYVSLGGQIYGQYERHQWPLLLTWLNRNPSMDKLLHAL